MVSKEAASPSSLLNRHECKGEILLLFPSNGSGAGFICVKRHVEWDHIKMRKHLWP